MSENLNHQPEFDRLLGQLSDGRLGDDDLRRLGNLLELDATLRRQYLDYCQMHALLRSEHGLLTSWSVTAGQGKHDQHDLSRGWWSNRRLPISLAAAAILVALAVGLALLNANRPQSPFRGAETAVLSKAVGAQFAFGVNGE